MTKSKSVLPLASKRDLKRELGTWTSPELADRNVCPTPVARRPGVVIALAHKHQPKIEASERLGLMKRFRCTVVMSDAEALVKLQEWLAAGRVPAPQRSDCEKAIAQLSVVADERLRWK